jgi:hypothetical protein
MNKTYLKLYLSLSAFKKLAKSGCVCKIYQKRLLASTCLHFCSSAWNNAAPTGQIFIIFYIWLFFENMSRKFKFHYILFSITFFQKLCRLRDNVGKYGRRRQATDDNIMRILFACWIVKSKDTHLEQVLTLPAFHGKNGYANDPQSYVTCTFPLLFVFNWLVMQWFRTSLSVRLNAVFFHILKFWIWSVTW